MPTALRCLAWTFLAAALTPVALRADEPRSGEQIYRQRCATCHGAAGEGTKRHKPPLAGDLSVAQLAKLIEKTMPEDDPGSCVGDEARRVASYIHDAFYSKTARARHAPPRIELARLTVRQYRHALADLVGTFRAPGRWDEQRGLAAEYSAKRNRGAKPLLVRRDGEVWFDFKGGGPDPAIDAKEFFIRWQGSVLAPETGDYEFVIHSDNGVRLWVNDTKKPLVDAWVKSGSDTEFRGSLRLLGGRAYPLRLEFLKSPKEKKASVALAWKLPGQAETIVPGRHLAPHRQPETFVAETPFPPDDRSVGYERGTSVSKAWVQATRDASLEAAAYISGRLKELADVPDDGPEREQRARDFCRRFAERAFRRPLTDEQRALYVGRAFDGARDVETAVKRAVLLVLNSPRFLYAEAGRDLDGYAVAARLSLGLWDSLPDPALLEAAAAGKLAGRAEVARQAERMLTDVRARAKLRDFFLGWLKVDPAPDLSKNRERFPGFDAAVATDLRASLELSLDDLVWGPSSDFRQLLLAEHLYLNGRLARFYGIDLPADAPFQKVTPEPGQRAGLLTHPYLMATFAYTEASSPIHRGVFLARSLLGQSLRPPPEAFTPLAPDLHPDLTTRQRVALQTKSQACQTCHGVINPLGFTLEHFDAVGRYREREKDRPVDATGTYQARKGDVVRFAGARDLAAFLAGSDEVHDAFVEQLFHHLVRQPVRAYGPGQLADLRRGFASHDYNIRRLAVEIMAASALTPRTEVTAAPKR